MSAKDEKVEREREKGLLKPVRQPLSLVHLRLVISIVVSCSCTTRLLLSLLGFSA